MKHFSAPAIAIATVSAIILAAPAAMVGWRANAASAQPATGGNTHLGPQSADPLRVPLMPPSYYTLGSKSFHSPAPKPPAASGNPQIYYVYPPSFHDNPPLRYRYYCPDTRRYYPDVRACASDWLKVIPGNAAAPD